MSEPDDGGLEIVILGLEFRVRPKHFRRGDLKLKCLATIAQLYWRSNEQSVQGDKMHRAPALEQRDAFGLGEFCSSKLYRICCIAVA